MYRETQITNGNGHRVTSSAGDGHRKHGAKVVAGNVADVIHDVVQLGELQVQLFATDSRAALRRVILPVVLLLFGLVTTLGCLPVFVLAGAYAIETSTELTFVNSLLASAGVALLVGLVLMACGGLLLRRVTAEFDTSWYELSRNIDWIKRTLKRKSTLGPITPPAA